MGLFEKKKKQPLDNRQKKPSVDSSKRPKQSNPMNTETMQRIDIYRQTLAEAKASHQGATQILDLIQKPPTEGPNPIELLQETLNQILENQKEQTKALSVIISMLSRTQK